MIVLFTASNSVVNSGNEISSSAVATACNVVRSPLEGIAVTDGSGNERAWPSISLYPYVVVTRSLCTLCRLGHTKER